MKNYRNFINETKKIDKLQDDFVNAAANYKLDLVQNYIQKGADVNKKASFGGTALAAASSNSGNEFWRVKGFELVKYLVEQGADVNNSKDSRGYPCLFDAIWYGNFETAYYLMSKGAKVDIEMLKMIKNELNELKFRVNLDKDDEYSNEYRKKYIGYIQIREKIIEELSKTEPINKNDYISDFEIELNNKIKKDLKRDPVLAYKYRHILTPEQREKYKEFIILDGDFDVFEGNVFSKKTKENINNSFIEAVKSGNLNAVKKCLEQGADIHYIDDLAVRWSAVNNHLDIFTYLAENGANVNANNNDAINYICEMGYSDLLKYLAQKGIIRIEEGCIRKLRKGGKLSDDLVEYLLKSDASYIKILKDNLTEEQKEKYKGLLTLSDDFDIFED